MNAMGDDFVSIFIHIDAMLIDMIQKALLIKEFDKVEGRILF